MYHVLQRREEELAQVVLMAVEGRKLELLVSSGSSYSCGSEDQATCISGFHGAA